MKKQLVDVRIKTSVTLRERSGDQVVERAEPFTSPSVEVAAGEYSRRFTREGEPHTLTGAEEINAVLGTGLFEVVEGSARFENEEPPAAAPGTTGGNTPSQGQSETGAEERDAADDRPETAAPTPADVVAAAAGEAEGPQGPEPAPAPDARATTGTQAAPPRIGTRRNQ